MSPQISPPAEVRPAPPARSPWRWFILFVVIVAAMGSCIGALLGPPLPDEEQLLMQFAAHKTELETLQRMVDEDRIASMPFIDGAPRFLSVRVGEGTESREPDSLPPARRAEYLRLMNQAGVPFGLDHGDFVVATEGRHRKAHQVGFTVCPTEPDATFVAHLEDAGGSSDPHNYYRRIDNRWCLIRKGGD